MAETLTIRTASSTEVVKIAVPGPQGPKGDKGDPGDVASLPLTTQGDILYRGASENQRLPIGTTGQVLKVAGGIPEWANESGAVSSVAGKTGVVTLDKNDVGLGNVANTAQVTSVTGTAPIVSSGGTTPAISISAATTSAAGSMSAADKTKLDGIAANATANSASSSTPSALGTEAAGSSSDYSRADHVHSSEVSDSAFRIIGSTDATKKVAIEVDANVPTASVVTLTAPASSGTLALGNQSVNDTDSPSFLGIYVGTNAANATNIGEVTITSGGLALSMEEPNGGQVSMRWFSPATTGDGNHWGFGCDTLNTNENNFFVWDFINNRPALWTNGDTGNVVFGGEYAEGTLPAKVQVIGISPSTATLLGLDNKTAGAVAQKIRAAVSQSANLSEWLDSSGNLLLSVNSSGNLVLHDNVGGANTATFTASSQLTGNRSYNVPDASGTLALTSDIPANTIASTLVDAKGDLIVGTAADTVARLPVGATNGHVLTVDSAEASGMKWAAASGGVSAVDSTLADVMSVSGSNLVADDGGTIDSADPFIKWDDTAGKLVYANPLSRPSGAFYVGLAPTTTALGTNSVNIQSGRDSATHLAKDASSVCVGYGARSTSSAATAIGHNSTCGNGSFAGGFTASAGNDAVAVGSGASGGNSGTAIGRNADVGGNAGVAIGYLTSVTAVNAVAVGYNVTGGAGALRAGFNTRPFSAVYWSGQTTTNAATILNLDGTATNRFTIAASTALAVDILVVARRSTTQDKWLVARRFLGIRRDGSNNTSLIGAVQTLGTDQSAGSPTWTFALTADDTNEALQLEVTGATGETVEWRATAFYRVA